MFYPPHSHLPFLSLISPLSFFLPNHHHYRPEKSSAAYRRCYSLSPLSLGCNSAKDGDLIDIRPQHRHTHAHTSISPSSLSTFSPPPFLFSSNCHHHNHRCDRGSTHTHTHTRCTLHTHTHAQLSSPHSLSLSTISLLPLPRQSPPRVTGRRSIFSPIIS